MPHSFETYLEPRRPKSGSVGELLGIILSALALFWAPVGRQLEGAINSSPYLLAIGRLFLITLGSLGELLGTILNASIANIGKWVGLISFLKVAMVPNWPILQE